MRDHLLRSPFRSFTLASLLVGLTVDCAGEITYPTSGEFGPNLLAPDVTSFTDGSFRAVLPSGTSLRIVMTLTAGSVPWSFAQQSCWTFDTYDSANERQEFMVSRGNQSCDMNFFLDPGTAAHIEYFENGAATAVRSKDVTGG